MDLKIDRNMRKNGGKSVGLSRGVAKQQRKLFSWTLLPRVKQQNIDFEIAEDKNYYNSGVTKCTV